MSGVLFSTGSRVEEVAMARKKEWEDEEEWLDEDWEEGEVEEDRGEKDWEEVNKGKTVERRFVGERRLTVGVCKRLAIPSMDIPAHLPRPEVARLIPLEVARELMAVPLAMEEEVLTVAVASPDNRESIDALAQISGHQVFLVLSPPDQLEAALQRLEALCYGDPCDQPSREKGQHAAH